MTNRSWQDYKPGCDHRELLSHLPSLKGKVMVGGYWSRLYEAYLGSGNRHDFDQAVHAAGSDSKRRVTESIWCNS